MNLPSGGDPSGTAPVFTETHSGAVSSPDRVPSVRLALLGDVMLGRDIHPTSETFSYLELFLNSADLVLANLESPLTNSPVATGSPYALCAPPENVRYLVDANFDLLGLANNHRLDCGADGLIETQRTLTGAGLGYMGPGPEPVYRSIHGVQLAFMAFDATAQFNLQTAVESVQSARQAGAIVIVSIHWGTEYQAGASSDQKRIAESLAEAGATLIWGHHPHVLQPAEWTGSARTLVLYSLGNALFDQHGLESTRRSALVLVTLDSRGVEKFQAIPFLIDVRNSRVMEPEPSDSQLIMQYFR